MKVQIEVDVDVCIGSGNCVGLAEGAFALNSRGVAEVVDANAASIDDLQQAESSCPTAAISLIGDGL